jgi:hypothetical protein
MMDFERTHGLISDEAYQDAMKKIQDVNVIVQGIVDKTVKVTGDTDDAQTRLTAIQTALDELVDKTIHVHVEYDSNGYPQAAGGDYMVSTPTVFIAGEAGPERATFTPMGSSAPRSVAAGETGGLPSSQDTSEVLARILRQLENQPRAIRDAIQQIV